MAVVRVLLAAALAAAWSPSAPARQVLPDDRPLSALDAALPLVEPHVAINPSDARHWVVAAIAPAPVLGGPWHCAAFTTFDAGRTWARHDLATGRCIDPWVQFAADGTPMIVAIEIADGAGDQRFELLQFVSGDGGRTWPAPRRLGRGFEHPMLAASSDRADEEAILLLSRRTSSGPGPEAHQLHVAHARAPAWTFTGGRELTPSPAGLNVSGIAHLANGEVVATYWESRQRPEEGAAMRPRGRALALHAPAIDAPFAAPALITEECASGVEGVFPGYPSLAHDRARATLHYACIAPGLQGLTIVSSPDSGRTWQPPVRIARPPGRTTGDARTAMIAVNHDGAVAVAWYDGLDDPERGRCQDVYLTVSTNGAVSFPPSRRVSTATSCPRTEANGRVAQSWAMGGDYGSLTAAPDGRFVLVWADSRSGRFALRFAQVDSGTAPDAAAVLARAQQVMGDAGRLARAGGVTIDATGTLNKGAEFQGRTPDSLDPGPFVETLTVAADLGRVAYGYREDRYDGTFEELREIYPGGDDRLIVVPGMQQVITLRSADHGEARRKLLRRVPALLIEDVRQQPADVRLLGETARDTLVAGVLSDGTGVTLAFDKSSGVLTRLEYRRDVQGFGDAALAWHFDDYAPLAGVGLLPRRYRATIDGRVFTDMRVTQITAARNELLAPPPDYKAVGPIALPADADAAANAGVETIAPGIHRVRQLRTGFHPLFVEFDDFVVALDAPAGYRLLNELPAGDVAPGPSSAWLSERFISLIKQTIPDKPIRYVVLTHFHNDHAGGVRAFVAEGATVMAAPQTAAFVERLVQAPHTLAPDRLSASPRPLRLDIVYGRRSIGDGARSLELLDVGANPHGAEMLVARLAAENLMFVSDLVDPVPVERYPLPSHASLDLFFGRWLAARGFTPERVYTMHGTGLATPAHLARLRPAPAR